MANLVKKIMQRRQSSEHALDIVVSKVPGEREQVVRAKNQWLTVGRLLPVLRATARATGPQLGSVLC